MFAIENEEQANALTSKVLSLAVLGHTVLLWRYADQPPIIQCKQCWKYGHVSTACNLEEQRCCLCSDSHTEAQYKEDCKRCREQEAEGGMDVDGKEMPCNHNLKCRHCRYKDDYNHPSDSQRCPKCVTLYGTARVNKWQQLNQSQNEGWTKVQNQRRTHI